MTAPEPSADVSRLVGKACALVPWEWLTLVDACSYYWRGARCADAFARSAGIGVIINFSSLQSREIKTALAHFTESLELRRRERAVMVGVLLPNSEANPDDPLDEIRGLAETAGLIEAGSLLQKRDRPDAATYIGSGKVEELRELVEARNADVVVFDNDLAPSQTRNLEKALDVKVIDRTEVILDIFAGRARTHEAHLQVELAQLEYALPRLKRMWTHLSRYKGGIGVRGPGEKQLEEDRRIVEHRIRDLKQKLSRIQSRKEREVAARSGSATVSLVGYTNAGKSTLMNRLTSAGVYVEDKLFATLDTRTRRWSLPGGRPVLLSDTVGFIRNLPHSLVASFKATLEEARQADLLLHLVDASNTEAPQHILAVNAVLAELGLTEKPTLLVLNKSDRLSDRSYLDVLMNDHPRALAISASTGQGIDQLERAVRDTLDTDTIEAEVVAPAEDGRVLAFLNQNANVQGQELIDGAMHVACRMSRRCYENLTDRGVRVYIKERATA